LGRSGPESAVDAIEREQHEQSQADRDPHDDQPNAQRSEILADLDQGRGGLSSAVAKRRLSQQSRLT
jgi:hypothetical protein